MVLIETPERKSEETFDLVYELDYGESVDLSGLPVKFIAWSRYDASEKIIDDVATAVDVTPVDDDIPEKSIWQLVWQPELSDVTVEERVVLIGEFEIDHGGETGKRYHPPGSDFFSVVIVPH
jgi:hypothetical protein